MIGSNTRCRTALLGATACAAFTASPASAQAERELGAVLVDDIVVTAQRREERLQDVPISITAIGANSLARAGVDSAQDLAMVVPGLVYSRSQSNSAPFLRGVGRITSLLGSESPVAQYIDGVYQAAGGSTLISLNNVERVEVLKGPQGTLFGRNATGGVINVVTRDPSSTPSADISLGYGNYRSVETQAYLSAGVADGVAADLALLYRNQMDGWGYDVTDKEEVRKGREFAVRNKWVVSAADKTSLTVATFYNKSVNDFGGYAIAPGATGLLGARNTGFYDYQGDNRVSFEFYGAHARMDHDFGWAKLANILSYQQIDGENILDADGGAIAIVDYRAEYSQKTWTNELQLLSSANSRLQWIVGLFYLDTRIGADTVYRQLATPPANLLIDTAAQKTRSIAPFGQATVELLPNTKLTFGIRYTADRIEIQGRELNAAAAVTFDQPAKHANFNKLTYRVALDHKFTDDVLAYASFNRGFKSAGFNMQTPTLPALSPEILDAYEIGLKTTLFDRRVRANIASFYYDYTNMIVRSNDPITNRVLDLNAGASRIKGFNIDVAMAVTPKLNVTMGAEYLDAKFTRFIGAPVTSRNPAGGNTVSYRDASGNLNDASGNRLIQAPEWSLQSGLDYRIPVGASEIGLNANWSYTSKFYWAPDNRFAQPGKHLVNAAISWALPDEGVELRLWGRNVFNTRYIQQANAASTFGDVYAPGAPRSYGVTLNYRFD